MKLSTITKPEYFFYTHDGKILRTIRDLEKYFNICTVTDYSYHANAQRNDWANWIEGVLLLPELAEKLRNSKSLEESKIIMNTYQDNQSKEVPEEKSFRTVDGYSLRSLQELYYYLHSCNEQNFYHHVNSSRNDFCNWINDALGEKYLGEKLSSVKDLKDSISIIREYVRDRKFSDIPKSSEPDKLSETLKFMEPDKDEHRREIGGILKAENPVVEKIPEKKDVTPDLTPTKFKEYSDEELEKYVKFSKREQIQEEQDMKMEYLLATVKELKGIISDLRKYGKDALISELMIRMLSSKIEFYRISKREEDYNKIIGMLNDLRKELDYIERTEQHSFAEDILKELEVKTLAMKKNV